MSKKVMLAEDDATMVALLKTLLKMEGFEVAALSGDVNVHDAVTAEKPDILILDFHLFSQNGLDILDSLRNAEDTRNIRVIMSSGANVKEECMSHGADDFLLKPYMPDDLISILKK